MPKKKYLKKIELRTDVPIPNNCEVLQVIGEKTIGRERYTDIKALELWVIVEEQ